MNMTAYRAAMAQIKFDEAFEATALTRLSGVLMRRRRRQMMLARGGIGLAVVLAAAAIAIFSTRTAQAPSGPTPIAAAPPTVPASASISIGTPTAIADMRTVVVSSAYGGSTDSYVSPQPGQALIAWEIRQAMDDPHNANAYYFVQLDIFTPEAYESSFSEYVYNGHSITEWRELAGLADGTYPYDEYNGDHGGSISQAQWETAQEQAKALDPQSNLDAAEKEYAAEVASMLAAAKTRYEETELSHLKQLGYDVFFMETWSYLNESEKQYARILAGILSAAQLESVADGSACGYFIRWVHNGDGIVDWDESLRP